MAGIADLLVLIPPVLLAQWSYNSTTLSDARILDSTDPTYGAIGWLPPTNGSPFTIIELAQTKETTPEPNRVLVAAQINIFLALDDAETPAVTTNFEPNLAGWFDSLRQVIAANRRLGTASYVDFPTSGDVRWEFHGGKKQDAKPLLGGAWFGAEFATTLTARVSVTYQG
jgi:hypothetical protein